jgi:polysaccharide biosynthesis transport protein
VSDTPSADGKEPKVRRILGREPDREGYELRHYLSVLRRRKLAILIPTLLGLLLGIFLGTVRSTTYTSTAEVIAQVLSPGSVLAAAGGGAAGTGAAGAATEVAVLNSQAVQNAVRDRVGHDVEAAITTDPDSDVSRITVEGENREQVQQDAQAYAESYVQLRQGQLATAMTAGITQLEASVADVDNQITALAEPIAAFDEQIGVTYDSVIRNSLENQRAALVARQDSLSNRQDELLAQRDQLRLAQTVNPSYGVEVLGPASEPENVGGPGRLSFAIAGAGLGFLLGLVLAFVREQFDDKVFSKRSVEAASGLPVIGVLPRVRGVQRKAAIVAELSSSPSTIEAFRRLRTSIQLALADRGGWQLLVASPDARDGRTMTAANLAVTLAAADCMVLLVDANMRRPRLHEVFDASNDVGLSSVLSGRSSVSDAVQSLYPNLAVLTAGPPVADPASLLAGPAAHSVLNALAREADYLIIDGPPLLPVSDGLFLAQMVDGVVLVTRARRTKGSHIEAAMELLNDAKAPMLGVVLNGVKSTQVAAPYADTRPPIDVSNVAVPPRMDAKVISTPEQKAVSTSDSGRELEQKTAAESTTRREQ